MTTALKAITGGNKQRNERKQASEDKSIRPHCKVSIEDINWVRQQPPSVQQLWLDSGAAHKLDTNLTYKSFQKAGAALTAQGLFQFEEVFGRLPSGRPGLISYRVRNLHGYYNRFYWESSTSEKNNSCDEKAVHAGEKVNQPGRNENHAKVEEIHADLESFQKNGQKSEYLQGFQNPNNVSNYPLTTYQQPTKVVGMVVGSDAQNKNSRVEETAHAPLGGASPSRIESASELEELPVAMGCTTLALVDDTPSQSASLRDAARTLLAEKQDCSIEARDCYEGTGSSASVAQNEKSLNSVIANQTPGLVEQGNPTSLLIENSVSGGEVKAVDEGTCSVAPVTSAEKWSHEAIVARLNMRPVRREKLNRAANSGDNPGFDFLQECWNGDPALQIVIKKLLVKFPQWGITCIDGVLVNWNE